MISDLFDNDVDRNEWKKFVYGFANPIAGEVNVNLLAAYLFKQVIELKKKVALLEEIISK